MRHTFNIQGATKV